MDDNKNNPVAEPEFQNEKMRMPEEQFGSTTIEEPERPTGKPNMGPFIAILAIILIIVLAGLYLWSRTFLDTPAEVPAPTVERPAAEENNEPESTTAEVQTESLNVVSTSNEVGAIEADLESTNTNSLDAELQAIEAEINAALVE